MKLNVSNCTEFFPVILPITFESISNQFKVKTALFLATQRDGTSANDHFISETIN